jgi:hypothetical protein
MKTLLPVITLLLLSLPITVHAQVTYKEFVESSRKQMGTTKDSTYLEDHEILKFGFTFTFVTGYGQQNEPVESIEQLSSQINALIVDNEVSLNVYDKIQLLQDTIINGTSKYKLTYKVGEKDYNTFSYYKPYKGGHNNARTAILILPGSGINEATAIHHGLGYHGNIADIASAYGDVYTNLKPNDDFNAIHNNRYKLDHQFIFNNMINKGSSYSASYLVNSIAATKRLKEIYDIVIVIGLSQGARVALYNSLQAEPTAAIASSGFTILFKQVEWAGHDQFMIPGLYNEYPNDRIKSIIASQSTGYLFSWGSNEIGVMRIEGTEGITKDFFQDVDNVQSVLHDQGHVFPTPYVEEFFRSYSSLKIKLAATACYSNAVTLEAELLNTDILNTNDIVEYTWQVNGETITGSNRPTLEVDRAGIFSLVLFDKQGKSFFSNHFKIAPELFDNKLAVSDFELTAPFGSDYKWFHDGRMIMNENGRTLKVKDLGAYYVTYSNTLGCFMSETIDFGFDISSSMALNWKSIIYPNPVSDDKFTLEIISPAKGEMNLMIHDLKGRMVYGEVFKKESDILSKTILLKKNLRGLYVVTVSSASATFTHKLIIN